MTTPRIARRIALSALVLLAALLLAFTPLPGRATLAATPTAEVPPSPAAGARATPAASPVPEPSRCGATPQIPLPDKPGELAGVRYDPDKDTVGAGDKVLGYRDAQLRNGVPQGDANRIALAHYTYDCQQTGNCDATGLALSGVDVNDAHANFGYHPECQVWGVDFKPWWGVWSPPDNQPNCAGGGGTNSGGSSSGGLAGVSAAGLARTIVGSLDFKALLTAVIKGLWELVIGDGIEQIGAEIARFLLATPNLLSEDGGMANVQDLVDALRLSALGACLVMFAVTVVHFTAGREEAPQAALGRLLAVMLALGFYRLLVGWLLRGANELALGIQAIGSDTTTGLFTTALKGLVPAALPFWYLLSVAGGGLVIAIGVVKILGLAFLLLTYVAGPLLLPLAIHPRTAGWVGLWAEHLVKALLWPVLWALEFRLFGALAGGLSFVDARGQFSPGVGALGALTSLALLVIMAGTPWTFHARFTLARYGQVVVRQGGRLADAAALAATGGAATTIRGAVALTVRERGAARAAAPQAGASRGEGGD